MDFLPVRNDDENNSNDITVDVQFIDFIWFFTPPPRTIWRIIVGGVEEYDCSATESRRWPKTKRARVIQKEKWETFFIWYF